MMSTDAIMFEGKFRVSAVSRETSPDPNQLPSQNENLKLLLDLSCQLNSTLDLDTLLDRIIHMGADLTLSEGGSILLLDEETNQLHFEAVTGMNRSEMRAIDVPLEGSIAGWIVQHNQPQIVYDTHQDGRHYDQVDRKTHFTTSSLLGVPLRVKNRTIGVLEVVNKQHEEKYSDQDVETLEILAAQAAVAIENARLYKTLQKQMQALQTTQARLVQSEKLAAVGELVAGVAHELNNPLTAIIGFAELLKFSELDESGRGDLNRIIAQGQRAATIVQGLLDFARQRESKRESVQVNDVICSVLDFLRYELERVGVTVQTELEPDLPPLLADPNQLQQVFVNLITNACQAIGQAKTGDTLTIKTKLENAVDFDHEGAVTDEHLDSMVRIVFKDNGPGIEPDHLNRVFDPFFTTKQPGEGTGLGLSVCHGIVSELGGQIWAESSRGQGAVFVVSLPVPDRLPVADFEAASEAITPPTTSRDLEQIRNARILLIDDEGDVLAVLMRALQGAGFQVDAVSSGQAALACLAEVNYDLVLCDIQMPGLNGAEIYELTRQRREPQAHRFVFVTGDIANPQTGRFLERTGVRYIVKPFEPSELVQKIQRFLSHQEVETHANSSSN